ncbi:hypothetical protein [Burkholderia multivorans]|uniref:Uncharacterized protein n=1 Tax=Burkholderia multivorans TaxID=87883 RepID=A0AAP2HN06_9BURK|nr:hypothetical protein [Burkholderia multivorans]MBU9358796.1 hypothetical protein [Burkholderia multivorans]MBU9596447.1 hypothetical protein [Burkholderia multivorans]
MKAVSIDLENCYGIKRLQAKFDFSKAKACAIYAPNGSMKSSLAQTFQDVADGTASRDRIFTARACRREIKDEAGTDLSKGSVLVVRPYDEVLGHSAKTPTLLVNSALRKESHWPFLASWAACLTSRLRMPVVDIPMYTTLRRGSAFFFSWSGVLYRT